jgi:hypothetical protein
MGTTPANFGLIKASFSLTLLLFVSVAVPVASAQLSTFGDSTVPVVYSENTGASLAAHTFPSFAQLPIIRPLPDPFLFANGTRESWERRRNEIKASIEKYEIGPKPDCHDCTIECYVCAGGSASLSGKLTVTVTRNGKSLTPDTLAGICIRR